MFFRLPTVPRPQDCRVGESVTSSPSRVSLARSLDRSQVTCSPARQSWRTSSNLKQSRCSRACLSLETPATQTILSEWSTSEENYLAFFSCGSIHYLNLRFCNTLGQRNCVSEVFIIILFFVHRAKLKTFTLCADCSKISSGNWPNHWLRTNFGRHSWMLQVRPLTKYHFHLPESSTVFDWASWNNLD